jgi:His/Glu/Gln/Arg/opine family amino acid ABC transporter permease subunit
MYFDPVLAWDSLPFLLSATARTLSVLIPVLMLGAVIAVCLAVIRVENRRGSGCVAAYVNFFRGVPSLVVLYMIYSGLPQFSLVRDTWLWAIFSQAYLCALMGLTLTHSAYMTEIVRGGLAVVPKGLTEASAVLGLTERQTFFRLRLPMAIRYALRAYQNEILIMIKSTAALSAITIVDLTAAANSIFDYTYDPFTPLLTAAAIYWCLTNIVRFVFSTVDQTLNRHLIAQTYS